MRLAVLLAIPSLSLAGLSASVAGRAGREAVRAHETGTAFRRVTAAGGTLITALQRERTATAVAVSAGDRRGRAEVAGDRATTDSAQGAFRGVVSAPWIRRYIGREAGERLADVLARLDRLPGVRAQADAGTLDTTGVVGEYAAAVDTLIRLAAGMSVLDQDRVHEQHDAIMSVVAAQEMMARENALVTAALIAGEQRFTKAEYAAFVQSVNVGRYLLDAPADALEPGPRAPVERLAGSADFIALHNIEDGIVARGAGASLIPLAERWRTTVMSLGATWPAATGRAEAALAASAGSARDRTVFTSGAAGGLGLLALLVFVPLSVRFSRRLGRELAGLQDAAHDLAREHLPTVIGRLRTGEAVEAEASPIELGRSSEVSRVADALTALRRTAVDTAVGEARLRQGIGRVFLSLAWRNQSLLQRQLSMLHQMELRTTDPDVREDLFDLAHLTTRMRRHAEGLVILSGSAPSRNWRDPVAIRDVMRGAIAEIEDHARVAVVASAPAALKGGAVADVTHLLAELVENAAVFSPPETYVHLRGEPVDGGYAIEVEDRGIGMSAAALAEANDRLTHPPEFDLADGDRLGLFIVGRLAARRGITVTLCPSPYGGIQAIVLLPSDLVVHGEEPPLSGEPRFAGTPRAPRGPHAAAGPKPALPRRVRQVNLAPQLRSDPPPRAGTRGPLAARSAEETRALIAALQAGWREGHRDGSPYR
jgi:signal transduction histidine kinase